ncbi:hypothetical protein [Clostridium pasteurianum]|nr:hypothetical protein [Clostridium pasteurianum]ELP59367.1 metal dependent phosphohydrolase [Clostridium pasteurianum DSM 525 = ATCC 6013]
MKSEKIPNKLYTVKAKEIAQRRIEFMEEYFNRLKSEVEGIE